jgi:magnesium chelatase family protein
MTDYTHVLALFQRPNQDLHLIGWYGNYYQKCISGPLLDCTDIHIQVPRVAHEKHRDYQLGEKSRVVQQRVEAACQIQRQTFIGSVVACNAVIPLTEVPQ